MMSEEELKECISRVNFNDPRTIREALHALRQELDDIQRIYDETWKSSIPKSDKKSTILLLMFAKHMLTHMSLVLMSGLDPEGPDPVGILGSEESE